MGIAKLIGWVMIIIALIIGCIGVLYLIGFNELFLVGGDAYNFIIGREYGIGFIVLAGFLFLSGVIVLLADAIDTRLIEIRKDLSKLSEQEKMQ